MLTPKTALVAGATLLLPLLIFNAACDEPVEGFAAPNGAGGSGSGTGGANATTTSSSGGSTSTTTTGGGGAPVPSSLPFAVDDYYAPSGFMGDGEMPGNLSASTTCPVRAGEQAGDCHTLDYGNAAGAGFAGIYWQYPDGNWGTSQGLPMPDGAARLTFYAWSDGGGETVTFIAGGIAGGANQDTLTNTEIVVTLTDTPTEYELPIGTHDRIIGGFAWTAAAPLVFYVDDLQYKPAN